MVTANELLRQGKHQELWQMCCGFLSLSIDEFMGVQERLLMKQIELLSRSALGKKLLHGSRPESVEEFRRLVPLTTYKDYCPELLERREETLPVKPLLWAHSSGWSGDYAFKWIPLTPEYSRELSVALYAVGILSCCNGWGDTSRMKTKNKILFSVAPRPYISGMFADVLRMQIPIEYLPPLEEAEALTFEERIKLGFNQAISEGFDYFFGLSLVLVNVSEKIRDSSNKTSLRPFLKSPGAMWRMGKGKLKSRLAGRPMLPRDLWKIRGIIGSGTDSFVYKNRIKEAWGRSPLDLYACTEGGVIAAQTWDYEGMTFFPNLNFLEFIPEDEQLKNQFDRSYQPKTVLLNEVKAGENYEIVITGFHGGVITRYRIGDMIRIGSLRNEKLGIDIPQMTFERRVDDFIDFYVVILTEKKIWQAIESSGVSYQDWIAYKDAENLSLNIGIELKEGYQCDIEKVATSIYKKLVHPDDNGSHESNDDLMDMADFGIKIDLLPKGTFGSYIARRQAEGADLAHLKPPHVNPPKTVLSILTAETQETIIVNRSGVKKHESMGEERVTVL
jgi:hypothetical protein